MRASCRRLSGHWHHSTSSWHHIGHHGILHVWHLGRCCFSILLSWHSHLLLSHIVIHVIHHKLIKHVWELCLHFLLFFHAHPRHLPRHHISLWVEHAIVIHWLLSIPHSFVGVIILNFIWVINSLLTDLLVLHLFLVPCLITHW